MISSNQNEKVKYWVSLKDKKNRDINKEYIIEGEHLVLEAYKNGYLKTVIYCNNLNLKFNNIETIEVSRNVIEKISSIPSPQNIIGIASYFNELNTDIDDKIIILDGVQDPGNAGTIVRNSLAFSYNLVFFSNNSVDIYNSKFIRATQGYFYSLKIIRGDIINFCHKLIDNDYDIITTYLDDSSIDINKTTPKEKYALIFGNEGQGVSKEILDISTKKVIINMNKKVDSLNVAVASGIVMFQFSKNL